ncbi:unnamed protein product [Ceutorhynchus assimilis]|uniref:RRM domain-containing protein n=1 Tax=Ceutorhynchus assimilis TaxID=467358 RepID=A0A9N9ME34_9CUCU|nr:unnamed protein product [Ceutorhynchus assimilis]
MVGGIRTYKDDDYDEMTCESKPSIDGCFFGEADKKKVEEIMINAGLGLAQSGDLSRSTSNSEEGEKKSNDHIVWVVNVAHRTKANHLKIALSAHGKVVKVQTLINANYPGSSCYGRVTMASSEDVDKVIKNLNNTELDGQMIKLTRDVKQCIFSNNKKEKKDNDNVDSCCSVPGPERTKGETNDTYGGENMWMEGFHGERVGSAHLYRRKNETILTFAQIKEERERQKIRNQERSLREEKRRRIENDSRQPEANRHQQEHYRLKQERGLQMKRTIFVRPTNESSDHEKLTVGKKESEKILEENARAENDNGRFLAATADSISQAKTKSHKSPENTSHSYDREIGHGYDRQRSHQNGKSPDYDAGRSHDYQRERSCDFDLGRDYNYNAEHSGLTTSMGSSSSHLSAGTCGIHLSSGANVLGSSLGPHLPSENSD